MIVCCSYLFVVPKDRRVVCIESVLRPTNERQLIAKVLYEHFEVHFINSFISFAYSQFKYCKFVFVQVPSVLFAPSHLLSTMPFRACNAIVVDVGHRETLVLPVGCCFVCVCSTDEYIHVVIIMMCLRADI